MGSKDRIIQLRTENPLMNLVQIGQEVGTSKQYVHKILKKAGLHTNTPKHKIGHNCLFCDSFISGRRTSRLCSKECSFQYNNLPVVCSFCRYPFLRKRSAVIQGYRRGYTKVFCSPACRHKGAREKTQIKAKSSYRKQQDELSDSIDWK